MFFDTIDDLKRSGEIYTDFLNEYMHMGEELMADFVVLISILRRAVDLNNAFITLTDSGNYIAAAPLLRLQLDNMLYCYARTIAANDNDFLVGFMDGSNWKEIIDKDGNKLSDDYLLDLISKRFGTDEFKRVYKESSKFIHLSTSHIHMTTFKEEDKYQFRLPNYGHNNDLKDIMLVLNYCLLLILANEWVNLRMEDINRLEWLKEQNPNKTKDELIQENCIDNTNFRKLLFSQLREKK